MTNEAGVRRRDVLRGGLAGAAAGALATSCGGGNATGASVRTTQRVRWEMASSFPRNLDTIYGAAEVLAEAVDAMTDGNFKIRVNQAGELVGGLEVLDAVQQGSAHCGQTGGYYYTGKNPALAFDTCVPFGLTARQQTAWLHEAGGLELMNAVYADFGVRSFPGGNTGAQMGGWFRRKIGGLADLQGLNMRIPGMGGKVMKALGVNAQSIAGGDIYPALERGTIDATEWVGPYDDEKLGFHQIAKHYYYPGWWEPGPALSFLVNAGEWERLPSAYKAAFVAGTHQAATAMQTRYDAKNPAALERLRKTDVEMSPFSQDILDAAREAAAQLLADEAAADAGYRQILESWTAFRDAAFDWFGTAELAYAQFAFGS